MGQRMDYQPVIHRRCFRLAVLCSFLLASCAGGGETPELLAIQPGSVIVNETLHLDLAVRNPSGVGLTYSFSGPDLPGLSQVTHIAGTPSGGEFIWTPLASHVGTHQFVFTITSPQGGNSQTTLIRVYPAASAAPIFLRPGAGGTYDLARDPYVRFEIEVRDDDSTEVDIRMTGTPPDGSQLVGLGPKQSRFEWLPTPEQIDKAERWTVQLEADDGDHEPTLHNYLIVLRSPTTDECLGAPPTITVLSPTDNARVVSDGGFPVVITVTDDVGIRDAPLLYFSTTAPADEQDPDVTGFEQTAFTSSGDQWTARIGSLGLGQQEERTVFFVVSVTDNDDPNGAMCDHRAQTSLHRFVAVGSAQQPQVGLCQACTSSSDCISGLCATYSTGGECLAACGGGGACTSGTCMPTVTMEGATVDACGDVETVCHGGGETCDDDDFEPNDSFTAAPTLTQSPIDAEICPENSDYYRLNILPSGDTDVTVTISDYQWEVADLDLELFDDEERLITSSAGIGATETVHVCLLPGTHVFIHVFGYTENDYSSYSLQADQLAGLCCVNDSEEPDDSILTAQPIELEGLFEGRICPGDNDYRRFDLAAPGTIEVTLVFASVDSGPADLDLKLYKPDGTYITGAFSWIDGEETLTADLSEAGTYVLRVYSVYSDEAADYLGEVVVSP